MEDEAARPSEPSDVKEPSTSATIPSKSKRRKTAERRTRVIAVANQKGGVGKSTTAVSLGAALAELGYRVLVVDLDPQGNASTGLGIRHERREITVYDVLAAEAPVAGAVVRTPIEGLDAIPSTIDLAGAEIELVSQFSRELRLRRALEPLKDGVYDFVLLDCPPSLGLLTVNALAAADELIVPIQCEYYALEGLGQLLRNVRLVQQNVNPGLHLTGIVLTMYDPRTKLSEQVVQEVRRFFGDRVYQTVIPRTVRLSEAPGFGQPITVYDPRSRGAECYRALAREVAARPPTDEPIPSFESVPTVVVPPPEPRAMQAPRPLRREGLDADEVVGPEAQVETEPMLEPISGDGEGGPAEGPGAEPAVAEEMEVGPRTRPAPASEPGPESATSAARPEEEQEVELARRSDAVTTGEPASGRPQPMDAAKVEVPASAPTDPAAAKPHLRVEVPSGIPDADGTEALIRALESEAAPERSSASEAAPTEPGPNRVAEIDLEEEPQAPVVEDAVVRIVDRDAAGEHEGAGSERERPAKRRWSLFRRGGDR